MSEINKLTLLHQGEESLRKQSLKEIKTADNLLALISMVECSMDLINHFIIQHVHENDDQLTIQCLGIRLFNGAASAVKLMLSGYYQTSAAIMRDILETVFLLDYLFDDAARISEWRNSDENTKRKKFAPAEIRKVLDGRDSFTDKKREKAYKLLCNLAAHPNYQGFSMITPVPGGDAHCGPFFETTALKACLEELAKLMVQAGSIFTRFFKAKTKNDFLKKIAFMEEKSRWFEIIYKKKFDTSEIDELRELIKACVQ